MSNQVRRDMFRKCERAIGNIEQAQEHLVWIVDLHRIDKDIPTLIQMKEEGTLTVENHRYAIQLTVLLDAITMLEMMKEGIGQVEKVLRQH